MLSPQNAFEDATSGAEHLRRPSWFILHYIKRWRWHFVGLLVLVLGAAGCSIGVQYGLKLLVDAIAGPRELGRPMMLALGLFLALMVGESLCGRLTGWLACRTTVDVGVDLRLDLFKGLSGQSMRYFAENLAGSLGQRITATAGNFGALTNTLVWRVLPPIIDFVGAVIIFATIDRAMSAGLAGFVIVLTGGLVWFGQRGRPLHRAYSGQAAVNSGDLIDTITNMWTIKAFSARRREWQRLARRFHDEALAQRRSWMHLEIARVIHDVCLLVMAATMASWVLFLWSTGRASPGDVVIVFSLMFRILHSSKEIALCLVDMVQQFGFIEETLAVLGKVRSVRDVEGAPALVCKSGAITFRDVSFSYAHRNDVVRQLNLFIPAGQKVGIVGPSGAGKSTLIHLLQRLHDVTGGEILIDGHNIASVTQDTLRAALAVVPQEITLLHRTVMENIRFARPGASDADVFAAARAASCDAFVSALPQGYDTIVGERGAKLSGGQRQRIGIARAFLKDAPIIILDEATSALDTETEMQIQDAIVRLMRNRTVIAVAHRLSTLTAFDRILVIDKGEIVEDGSIADLRRQGGLLDRMWRLQAEGLYAGSVLNAA